VTESDKVALRWVSRGTRKGPHGCRPYRGASDHPLHLDAADLEWRIEGQWAGFNTLAAFHEIGALPPLGQPAGAR
jgi:hypothetical protein